MIDCSKIRVLLRRPPFLGAVPSLVFLSAVCTLAAPAQDIETGERVYMEHCASCHGDKGQGVKGEYKRALTGDDSVQQLTRFIDRWMPDDDPKKCTGAEAERVAQYIHGAFYSSAAQARNKPVRASLSRLTVRQYQNSAADLIGHFRRPPGGGQGRGLRGEYFEGSRPEGERRLKRIDPVIKFDFAEDRALRKRMPPEGFSARWTGSVHAPETGKYKFLVRTDHAARLWVNNPETPIIDAWVQSGTDTEFRGTVYLTGGRNYPITLEFSSKTQGVQDKVKNKAHELGGFLELHWKMPHHEMELVPKRLLASGKSPEVFALQTTFPPDDRSEGYERGSTVSKAWDEAATEAAIEIADYIIEHLEELAGVEKGKEDYAARLRQFCGELAAHAFRAPLSESQQAFYIDRQFEKAPDLELAVKRIVLLALKSPRFLYTDLIEPRSDDYAIASTLSFTLWDSLPDRALLKAAAAGELHTRKQLGKQVERMIDNYRCRSKLREFLHHWLIIEETPGLTKRPELFPGFNAQLVSDMRSSLDLFLEQILADENPDFRELLLSRDLYLNGRLGRFLGFDLPADAPFERFPTKQIKRAGVLTHPYIMAKFAYSDTTSPIHRGVFLARGILGKGLRPPPEAVTPVPPDLHPEMMTRERVALQTAAQSCQSCHSLINPLGFALEHFDAAGRLRNMEIGKPVDASGAYMLPDGSTVEFSGSRDLAEFLVNHSETHRAFAVQLHHYLVKQPVNAYGADTPEKLTKVFVRSDLNMRRLISEIAINAALAKRSPSGRMLRQDFPSGGDDALPRRQAKSTLAR